MEVGHGNEVAGSGADCRVAALTGDGAGSLPDGSDVAALPEKVEHDDGIKEPAWKRFLMHVGPGFLISLAYLDPANMETDMQAGANDKYQLLWVILVGLIFGLIIQSLASNLGVVTGWHLAEMCRKEYPNFVNICLWLTAEICVIAADIPEVIGTAFALNILIGIPVWSGVLITGTSALLLIGLQKFGVRKLELLITTLVFVMGACFFVELALVHAPGTEVARGLFVPMLDSSGAVGDAIAVLGALVMPHNLFLHSALVLSRKTPSSVKRIKDACKFFLYETAFALFVSLLINIAMITVTAAICNADDLSPEESNICSNITLDSAPFLLKDVLGSASWVVYGIALLASGQSSTITGTYAGQFVMQGFLDIRMKKWQRNLLTRTIAILPSLVVSIIGGPTGAGQLVIIASMILSFELPFVLIPLMRFTSSTNKMGPHINNTFVTVIAWLLSLLTTGINTYYLISMYVGWLRMSTLPTYANVLISIVAFPLMALYLIAMVYLAFRKDKVDTFSLGRGGTSDGEVEKGGAHHAGRGDNETVPYREDLADIPLPE